MRRQSLPAGYSGPSTANSDVLPNALAHYAPLEVRPASRLEGSPDLQQPAFSKCTVPLIIW